jgi:predicted nucleic acid-binding protein
MDGGDEFNLMLLNLMEAVAGFSILPRAERNRREWALIRPTLKLLGLDEQDALAAADLQVRLRRRGHQLGTVDALIATTALRHDLTLLTTDNDFAPVPALHRENWLAP